MHSPLLLLHESESSLDHRPSHAYHTSGFKTRQDTQKSKPTFGASSTTDATTLATSTASKKPAGPEGCPRLSIPRSAGVTNKSRVPPPVPPRGSPRRKKSDGQNEATRTISTAGSTPSCSSTPPPAFDDISEDSSHRNNSSFGRKLHYQERKMNVGPAYRRSPKDDIVSISEIHLDTYLAVDTSSSSQYGSRGGLAWTPPASGEGSTPTWTEGTPSFTDSSSSGDTDNFSPINSRKNNRHKATVEDTLNSLSSDMVRC